MTVDAGQLQPYTAYKDSGVQWLGKVPAHWDIERPKWLFRKMDRSVREVDEVVTCFRDGVVTLRRNRRLQGFTESLQETGYQGIRRGDLVIHGMDAFAGAIGVADSDGKSTPVYSVCKPGPRSSSEYYAHALREMARSGWLQALTRGVRERSTDFRFDSFGSQLVPCPPLSEQAAIVRFFDHADRRIRRYIRAKENLIALLEEQKQAIIHEVVTGQVDVRTGKPYRAYKESGVGGLSRVPEHWNVRQLGRVGRFFKGSGGSKDDDDKDGIPCIRYGDLYTHHQFFVTATRACVEPDVADRYARLRHGDVLFAGSGETTEEIGKSAVNLIDDEVRCGGDVIIFRPSIDVDARFLGYVTDCPQAIHQKACMGRGITVMHIYASELKYLILALPPVTDQVAIAGHLDRAIGDTDGTVNGSLRQIEQMQEYRNRLIADVVTGKLDVREAAKGLPEIDMLTADEGRDDRDGQSAGSETEEVMA